MAEKQKTQKSKEYQRFEALGKKVFAAKKTVKVEPSKKASDKQTKQKPQ